MAFASFNKATKAEDPNYLAAQLAADKMKAQAEMQADALRSQNMIGGGLLYNAGMGDNSPIYDYLSGKMGGSSAPAMTPDPTGIDTALSAPVNANDMATLDGSLPSQMPNQNVGMDSALNSPAGSNVTDSTLGLENSFNPVMSPAAQPDMVTNGTNYIDPSTWGTGLTPDTGMLASTGQGTGGVSGLGGAASTEAALAESLAAANTGAATTGAATTGAATTGAATTGAATTGAGGFASAAGTALPWVGAVLAADQLLFDGKGTEAVTDPGIYEDIAGGLFGKGWLWS